MEKYDGSSDPVDHLRTFVDLMSSKWAKKTTIELMQLTQYKDKLLKDFIAWFNRATLEINDLHMSAVVITMMSKSRSHPFKISLSKNPLDTVHELLMRGDKYVDVEEVYFITKGMKDRKELESIKRKTRDEP
ncbi:Retrotransposon gag protein [Abeliophyllum distichum]|uniref:Retrotransposon gag protein n=1 Tax=Abeliophyllum distichum TaxID=126358 RepID=A0ABD1RZ57_9LAMI